MKKILKRINLFFRDLLLDDVDKEYEKPHPYHKNFGAEKKHFEIKEKRVEPDQW